MLFDKTDSSSGFRGCHYQLSLQPSVTAGEEQKVGRGQGGGRIHHVVHTESEEWGRGVTVIFSHSRLTATVLWMDGGGGGSGGRGRQAV